MINLNRIKKWLYGPSFTQLMKRKKTNKYQIAKGSGISYQTLLNWEASRNKPNDKSTKIVARYLGLISNADIVTELGRQIEKLRVNMIKAKLEKLK